MHMSLNNITSAELKKLISIVERKERVQEELREIESKLSTHLSTGHPNRPDSSRNAKVKISACQQAAARGESF